jgi:ubiquinone/menaquinone biosynthesis C-methylase UbiE
LSHATHDAGAWFERTYRRLGFRYLRPYAAYPIYLQLLAARAGERLLDVGCGPGLLLRAEGVRGLAAHGADLAWTPLALAREYVPDARLARADAHALPFADASFDLVTGIGVLERFPDRPRALAELRRVARPAARFCFLVRNARTLAWALATRWWGRPARRGHHDAKSLAEWTALFDGAGLAIDAVLPDQWPRQRLRRWLRAGRDPDFSRPERVARPLLPLAFANEFLFLLRHAAPRPPCPNGTH